MNWKKFILLGCMILCIFAASSATAQMRGHGSSMGRMGMRGAFMPRSMPRMQRAPMLSSMGRTPMHRAPTLSSMGRMPMHRAPIMNSASGLRRWGDGDFDRDDRFHRFNDGDFDRDDGFQRFNNFNQIIFIGDFSFPWWWGWGPWWSWNWSYPYGSYGYSDYSYPSDYSGYGYGYGNYGYDDGSSGYDYGSGYPSASSYGSYYSGTDQGNDNPTHSKVAELQRRLAQAGYYSGAIDGILGPETRQAIRAFERDHGY